MDKPRLAAIAVVALLILFLGSRLQSCSNQDAQKPNVADNTTVTVNRGPCLSLDCSTTVIVAEDGATVYQNEQSTTFGDVQNQQGEALNSQSSTFGGNTATLNSGDGASQNHQQGRDLTNDQDSTASSDDQPLLGTVPGWMWFLAICIVAAIVFFGFIRPQMLAAQLDRDHHSPPPYI